MVRKIVLFILICLAVTVQAQTDWYNPMSADEPYINGRAWNKEIGNKSYDRMPSRFEGKVTKAVWNLSHQSAGLSVTFTTNSKHITVRYLLTNHGRIALNNVVALNTSGVDLYATDVDGRTTFVPNGMQYTFNLNGSDTVQFTYNTEEMPVFGKRGTAYELYLPTYNGIKWMEIGVDKGSKFSFTRGSQEKPVVVYGTSIAHGASASRPGLIWTTLLKRWFDYPFINLGFSGSGKMENIMYDALSEIDAKVYILDCVPNCAGLDNDEFASRVRYGVRKLREKSNAPILFMDGNAIADNSTHVHKRFKKEYQKDSVQYEVYKELKAAGVKGLHYITYKELNMTGDDLIEGTHPNDLGMMKYAQVYARHLNEILVGSDTMRCYKPCVQRRDNSYEWMMRHNEIMEQNRTTDPEILMIGNSITHFWGGSPVSERQWGGKTWDKLFGKHRVTNMGMGWDRVENVYWRLLHGELDNCKPSQICLMIGTNNIPVNDSKEKIVSGIIDIVKLLRQRQPQAKIHVISIYPRKDKENVVRDINNLLEKTLEQNAFVRYHDVTSCLTLPDGSGKIDASCFREGLHPNEKGYASLLKAYKKILFK